MPGRISKVRIGVVFAMVPVPVVSKHVLAGWNWSAIGTGWDSFAPGFSTVIREANRPSWPPCWRCICREFPPARSAKSSQLFAAPRYPGARSVSWPNAWTRSWTPSVTGRLSSIVTWWRMPVMKKYAPGKVLYLRRLCWLSVLLKTVIEPSWALISAIVRTNPAEMMSLKTWKIVACGVWYLRSPMPYRPCQRPAAQFPGGGLAALPGALCYFHEIEPSRSEVLPALVEGYFHSRRWERGVAKQRAPGIKAGRKIPQGRRPGRWKPGLISFSVLHLPVEHRRTMKSTNMPERFNEELQRRTAGLSVFFRTRLPVWDWRLLYARKRRRSGRRVGDISILTKNRKPAQQKTMKRMPRNPIKVTPYWGYSSKVWLLHKIRTWLLQHHLKS